jgi:hypothetical protein
MKLKNKITFEQLQEIVENQKKKMGQSIKSLYPYQFQEQMIAQLQNAALHYEYDPNETDVIEVHNEKFRTFHDFQKKQLKPLALERIAELLTEIEVEVISDNFSPYLETMQVLLNHGHSAVREKAIQLIKNKYCLGAINYFVADILSGNEATIKTIFELSINTQDWELCLKYQRDWLPLTKALKKVAALDINLTEDYFYDNNSLYFMNVVANFCYFIPNEMASLENEIIHYLDLERYGHRSFECALYPFQFFYPELKPYFSEPGKQKMKTIIHQVAKDERAIDDAWVNQNVLPALKIVGENDTDCQATIASISALDIERDAHGTP